MQVLDHGYIELIESWGSEEGIIEAARMSTNKGFQGWGDECMACEQNAMRKCPHVSSGDEKLLAYLYKNHHDTPFEMAGMIIEVQAPIFVIREWQRHRTMSYNEMSARYTPLPNVNYVPTTDRLLQRDEKKNKQAGTVVGSGELNETSAATYQHIIASAYVGLENMYQLMLANGVPKELARVILPVGRYSRMRVSANLRNWLAFLKLRMADNAQYEIRQYANAAAGFISEKFPRTSALFSATM